MTNKTKWAVILDFDGTITGEDLGFEMLELFAPKEWRSIEDDYQAGLLTSQETTTACFRLLKIAEPDLTAWLLDRARTVTLRPGLSEFLRWCESRGIPVTVASSGADICIKPILEVYSLMFSDVRYGRCTSGPNGLEVSFEHLLSPDYPTERDAKRIAVQKAQSQGYSVVFVGDGAGDLPAARLADVVFARARLLALAERDGIAHHKFGDFRDVLGVMQALIEAA